LGFPSVREVARKGSRRAWLRRWAVVRLIYCNGHWWVEVYVTTFRQTSFALPIPTAPPAPSLLQGPAAGRARELVETASKATQITQELRRLRPEAPRLGTAHALDHAPSFSSGAEEEERQRLEHRISAHLPHGRLALAVTDNRFTMISVKRELERDRVPIYRARLHRMFLVAPPPVTRALARYIALNEKVASRELSAYIDVHQDVIQRAQRRRALPVTLETRGETHDLQEVFDALNRGYFLGRIDARITWGARVGKRRRRTSIKMGSYSVEDRLIRIHPSLDREFVPRYFLEWIVYHEMLHQVHDIPVVGGRRRFHTHEFLAAERRFDHYPRARAWERRNLDRILHY
jgi:hypothetical protein